MLYGASQFCRSGVDCPQPATDGVTNVIMFETRVVALLLPCYTTLSQASSLCLLKASVYTTKILLVD